MSELHGIDPAVFDKVMRLAVLRIVKLRHQKDDNSDEAKLGMMLAALHLQGWQREVKEAFK